MHILTPPIYLFSVLILFVTSLANFHSMNTLLRDYACIHVHRRIATILSQIIYFIFKVILYRCLF